MYGMNARQQSIAAATAATISFNPSELPGSQVNGPYIANWFLQTTGANNSLTAAITRVRVKANTQDIWNIPSAHLRAFVEGMAPANTIPPAARLRLTIPQNALGRYTRDQYIAAFPIGAAPQVEFDVDATSSAGVATIAWDAVKTPPQWFSKFLSRNTNVPATTNPGRVNLDQRGEWLYGIGFPLVGATGILSVRLVINSRQVMFLDQNFLLEAQFMMNPQSLVTTYFHRLDEMELIDGECYLEIVTGAGASSNDIISFLTLAAQPVQVQARAA